MSTLYDAARQYIAESMDESLAEKFDTEYAMLTEEQAGLFNAIVNGQAERLTMRLRQTVDAFMVDADPLPEDIFGQ